MRPRKSATRTPPYDAGPNGDLRGAGATRRRGMKLSDARRGRERESESPEEVDRQLDRRGSEIACLLAVGRFV